MELFDEKSTKSDAQKQAILDNVRLPDDWKQALAEELTSDNMDNLRAFLKEAYQSDDSIYPPAPLMFNALNLTPLSQVKVVILGQDPYHGPGQAMGLSFSVPKAMPKPPSLNNVLKEMASDIGIAPSKHGDLTYWAQQGVLLLNSSLTVREGEPNSHQNKGWEQFTDAVIQAVNAQDRPIVYLLWGRPAQSKIPMLTNPKHLILTAPHPSPLSAYRGFFGCRHFSKANAFLEEHGIAPIDWQIENI